MHRNRQEGIHLLRQAKKNQENLRPAGESGAPKWKLEILAWLDKTLDKFGINKAVVQMPLYETMRIIPNEEMYKEYQGKILKIVDQAQTIDEAERWLSKEVWGKEGIPKSVYDFFIQGDILERLDDLESHQRRLILDAISNLAETE